MCILVSGLLKPCFPLGLGLDSKASLSDGLAARLSVEQPGLECRILYARGGNDAQRIAVGLVTPWLILGPLKQAGLMREADNPLGFSMGSDVFLQGADCGADASFESMKDLGFLLAPLPEALSLFILRGGNEVPRAGTIVRASPFPGLSLDTLIQMSQALPAGDSPDWYFRSVRSAGGMIVQAGMKLVYRTGGLSGALSGCISGRELGPPGVFLHSYLCVNGDGSGASAFFGSASPGYRTSNGGPPSWATAVGAEAHVSGKTGAALVHALFKLGFPDPFHPSIPSACRISFSLEKPFGDAADWMPFVGLDAAVESCFDADGRREDDADALLRLSWKPPGGLVALKAAFTVDALVIAMEARCAFRGTACSLETALGFRGDDMDGTAVVEARFPLPAGAVSLELGIRDMPLAREPDASCLRCAIHWSVKGSAGDAPSGTGRSAGNR